MSLTFKEAREKVQGMEGTLWRGRAGTFYVSPDGFGDDRAWLVNYGPEEWMVDKDITFLTLDGDAVLVDINTGDVQKTTYLDDPERYDAMKPASVG